MRRLSRLLLLLFMILALAGCSKVKFAYNQLDWLKETLEQFEKDSQKAIASIILMSNLAAKDEWVRKRISHTMQKNIPAYPIDLEQLDANSIPKEIEYYQRMIFHQRDERELKFIVDIVENIIDQK